MTTTTPTAATTRHGVTIQLVMFTHDDFTQAWEVDITDAAGGRCTIPTWKCKDEAGARLLANAAFRSGARTALGARTEALR